MVDVRRIYTDGRHNAFTSLVEWRGQLFLAFRSGTRHVKPGYPDGEIRILRSADMGRTWEEVGLLNSPDVDMRDPKLLATPGRLYVHSFGYQDAWRRDALVCYTEDGASFTPFTRAVAEDNMVIWWPIHHDGGFYASGYRYHGNKRDIRSVLYSSEDGMRWHDIAVVHDVPWANESAIVMDDKGMATVLVRNDGHRLDPPAFNGLPVLAQSAPPYTEWTARELDCSIRGFALHRLPGGYLIVGRVQDNGETRTAIFFYDGDKLVRLHTLPSGGDTAYPGIVRIDDRVWLSYYSSHEESPSAEVSDPASIYLAEFAVSELMDRAGP
jgi:hypothetical protein